MRHGRNVGATGLGIKNKQTNKQTTKKTMINVLRGLMDKIDSMQEQMGNVTKQLEILRKN